MEVKIFTVTELKENVNLINSSFETWLYAYRADMPKNAYWTESSDESLEDIKKYYEKNKTYFFDTELKNSDFFIICIENSKILGQLELQIDDNSIIICSLGVHHKYRNKGVATLLLKSTANFVTNNFSSYNLISYVKSNNHSSINLHKKIGFETDGNINNFDSYEFKYTTKNLKI